MARRILIVDDEPDIRDLARAVLEGEGHTVATVDDGHAALLWLAAESCDLVLLDIHMPGMGGWETLRLIRADDELRDLPVAMFSIKGEIRDKVHALQEGATDYIEKPFVIAVFVERIGRLLGPAEIGGHGR